MNLVIDELLQKTSSIYDSLEAYIIYDIDGDSCIAKCDNPVELKEGFQNWYFIHHCKTNSLDEWELIEYNLYDCDYCRYYNLYTMVYPHDHNTCNTCSKLVCDGKIRIHPDTISNKTISNKYETKNWKTIPLAIGFGVLFYIYKKLN
jgi:hypothetical protein